MKKLFTYGIIWMITALLLASCSSSGFITKRRYTKGYYIAHSGKPDATKVRATKQEPKQPAAAPATASELAAAQQPQEPTVAALPPSASKAPVHTKKTSVKPQPGRVKKRQAAPETGGLTMQEPVKKAYSALREASLDADSSDDALSLLWIVIVVILILWLIGVLAGGWGLGFLLHVLLIIALILLILWLLRVL